MAAPARLWRRVLLLVLATIHATCVGYFALSAAWYALLPHQQVAVGFTIYSMVFELSRIHVVVAAHAGVAIWHAYALLEMLCGHRRLSSRRVRPSTAATVRAPERWRRRLTTHWLYVALLSRRGVLGLESAHFSEVFAVRESVETLLQTLQAYRLSRFVARRDINSVFVALLVINCWITPLIQHYVTRRVALQRLLCLSADIVLDAATTVLVPFVLLVPYVHQFDWRVGDFPMTKWYDLRWLITAMNEFQLIHVTSWGDLLMRLLFSVSMILSMNKVKYLLSLTPKPRADPSPVDLPPSQCAALLKQRRSLLVRALDLASLVWGLVVLLTFIAAERQPSVQACAMQTRPWFAVRASCALLVVTCDPEDTTAQLSQMRQQLVLNEVQPSTVMSLVLRDCAALHVTPLLADLHELVGLKISNSAIVDWSGDATLRDTQHPRLLFVFMERVTFRDGSLPDGLQARDFPRRLLDIEVCVSNLGALPADLDEKWAPGGIVFIERSALTHVPTVLLRMEMVVLSLDSNSITDVPVELLSHPTLHLLGLSHNPITTLPRLNASTEFTVGAVFLDDTKLESPLPQWALDAADRVIARRTPLCQNHNGTQHEPLACCDVPPFVGFPTYPLMDP
ncbi:hypothetical protein PINS_up006021 [Pythium insidiosum]|nr:hypothetical protein PINS_up006021 [Pythium insidiosum]